MASTKTATVLHDRVSFTHADHQGDGLKGLAPGQARAQSFADRGQELHVGPGGDDAADEFQIDEKELKRLVKLGAVSTDTDSMDAQLARRGQPPMSQQRRLPYTYLTSPSEAVNSMKGQAAFAGGVSPRSNPADLARLSLDDLKIMAIAFGHGALAEDDNVDKAAIIQAMTGQAEGAEDPEEVRDREQQRDRAQIAARQHGGQDTEPGLLGTNVLAGGRDATTGELPGEERPKSRRASKASRKGGGSKSGSKSESKSTAEAQSGSQQSEGSGDQS